MEKNFKELIEKKNNQPFILDNNNQSRHKSISFKLMGNESNLNNKQNKRIRFYSENIPLNFVPKLKPINPILKPTPMKLNFTTSKKLTNDIISEEIENKLSLSFENYSSNEYNSNSNIYSESESDSDSDSISNFDSNDDEYKDLNYKVNYNKDKNERKLSHIENLKNEMNQIKKELKKQKNSHDDLDSETSQKTIKETLNKDISNHYNYKNGRKRGVSIIEFLEENNRI
jgi:hypothetical protein